MDMQLFFGDLEIFHDDDGNTFLVGDQWPETIVISDQQLTFAHLVHVRLIPSMKAQAERFRHGGSFIVHVNNGHAHYRILLHAEETQIPPKEEGMAVMYECRLVSATTVVSGEFVSAMAEAQ